MGHQLGVDPSLDALHQTDQEWEHRRRNGDNPQTRPGGSGRAVPPSLVEPKARLFGVYRLGPNAAARWFDAVDAAQKVQVGQGEDKRAELVPV
jgi:hypothetical protein